MGEHRLRNVLVSSDLDELYQRCADALTSLGAESISAAGQFTLVLSGGSTPGKLYELLTSTPYRERLAWDRVHLFWGDERCVPPEHAESNFRLVQEELITPLGLSQKNLHRIKGELESPEKSAAEYEEELADFFRLQAGDVPRFDLILLGMGADGHTASLFPSDNSLQECKHLVVATRSTHGGVRRITLTLPTINHARQVFFLISGPDKAETVREVLEGSRRGVPLPAQLVEPSDGELRFYLDQPAASHLSDWRPGHGLQ